MLLHCGFRRLLGVLEIKRGLSLMQQRKERFNVMLICDVLGELKWKRLALFAGGVLFGTAGVSILSSKDAKKVYTHCTAAVLRCRDAVVNQTEVLKENCQDIYEDASDINEKRYEEEDQKKLEAARALVKEYEDRVNKRESAAAEG